MEGSTPNSSTAGPSEAIVTENHGENLVAPMASGIESQSMAGILSEESQQTDLRAFFNRLEHDSAVESNYQARIFRDIRHENQRLRSELVAAKLNNFAELLHVQEELKGVRNQFEDVKIKYQDAKAELNQEKGQTKILKFEVLRLEDSARKSNAVIEALEEKIKKLKVLEETKQTDILVENHKDSVLVIMVLLLEI
ncbi:unnamed protein product [Orchesella dallaii]|uniref:Uncharacterized protein n=1 Tax=Orchesella dallaii TaxID=48710 RepID=A0ABP1R7Q9_9HEXA